MSVQPEPRGEPVALFIKFLGLSSNSSVQSVLPCSRVFRVIPSSVLESRSSELYSLISHHAGSSTGGGENGYTEVSDTPKGGIR